MVNLKGKEVEIMSLTFLLKFWRYKVDFEFGKKDERNCRFNFHINKILTTNICQ